MNKTIIKILNENYKDAGRFVGASLIRNNDYNEVYLILLSTGEKRVLRISKHLTEKDVLFELDAISYFRSQGVKTPKFFTTVKNDSYLFMENKKIAVLFEFVEGIAPTFKKIKNSNIAEMAGRYLAKMQTQEIPFRTKHSKNRNILAEYIKIKKNNRYIIKNFSNGHEFLADVETCFTFVKDKKPKLPKILLQNDYRPQNVLIKSDKISAVIDFDWSCNGPAIWELSLALLEWSFPDGEKKPNIKIINNFLRGYNRETNNAITIDDLRPWMMAVAMDGACTYLLELISSKRAGEIRSYMYSKYKYLKQVER